MDKQRENKFTPHHADLIAWFEAEPTLRLIDACNRLAERGVKATPGELSIYLRRHREKEDRDRMLYGIATGAEKCRELDEAFAKNPAPELSLLIKLLKNLILNLNLNPDTAPEHLELATNLMRPVIEFARIEQKQRDAELNLEKFRDATRSKVDAGLDEIAALFQQAPELKTEFEALRAKLNTKLNE